MKESSLWKDFDHYVPGDHVRIENAISTGTPDVNYCLTNGSSGWIEFKIIEDWPIRRETKVDTGLRGDQAKFLHNRAIHGKAFLLLRVVKDEHDFLFPGKLALSLIIHKLTQEEFRKECLCIESWKNKMRKLPLFL